MFVHEKRRKFLMADKKKSFILYFDEATQFNMLSDAEAGKLIKALFEFAESGTVPDFSEKSTAIVFSFISQQIARDTKKWEKTCKQRSEAAKSRWNRVNAQNATNECDDIQMNANAYGSMQDDANDADNVNDNENENVNDNVNVNENEKDNENVTEPERENPKKLSVSPIPIPTESSAPGEEKKKPHDTPCGNKSASEEMAELIRNIRGVFS